MQNPLHLQTAPQVTRKMVLVARSQESVEADERREGLVSYINGINAEGRYEIAEAVEFDDARPVPEGGGPDFG